MEINDPKANSASENLPWILFLRQFIVCNGAWASYFLSGLSIGAPTVFIPQIRREANSTEAVSEEMASWLLAVFYYSGMPGVFILPALVTLIGRKRTHCIVCMSTFIGFLIFYSSKTVTYILISEIFQGLVFSSFLTVSIVILTEYTSSMYRGLFLTLKSAMFFWGILASNTIGTFLHWRNIPLLGLLCSAYSLLTVIIWPESPYWLVSKGRFDECAAAHRWLKGSDKNAEMELERLIKTYQRLSNIRCDREPLKVRVCELSKTISHKTFYKPVLLSLLLLLLSMISDKFVFTLYALDIMKKITGNEATAYIGMLILDAVTVFSMYVGCFVSKLLKRRTMLIGCSSISITFLFLISLYLYIVKLSIITENNYVSLLLLAVFSISVSCGPMIMSTSIIGELIPIKSKGTCICILALTFKTINASFIKGSPYLFKLLGIHGAFCFFGVSMTFCLILTYLYLPETKDKTLQEISDSMGVNQELLTKEATKLTHVTTNI